ncbi:HAD domain-containing protein [Kitasatospora sp. NPDC097643]|uniref:HAD domain-containing protein n=1 Tax=Kitasatospora sp. NPDC097643 TaxID=3157230 RepID=UPI00332503DA
MTGTGLPLLFLDVDGPLIPFGAPPPGGYPVHHSPYRTAPAPDASPLLTRVDPLLGRRLLSLPCELVWATTWLSDANDLLAPWLGLPQLPVVDWPVDDPAVADPAVADGVHWKTPTLLARAAGRPFVWVDDEIGPADHRWVTARSPAPVLLHRVDPQHGLVDADFATLDTWLSTV